jgi:hypothetical protein
VCVVSIYGCVFTWRFQWHHTLPGPNLAARDIAVFSRQCSCSCHAVSSFAERSDLLCHNSSQATT